MDMEAGNRLEQRGVRDIDRQIGWRAAEDVGEARQPALQHQHQLRREAAAAKEDVEHHLAFGDEAALAADQVALAQRAIGGDARVIGVDNADRLHGRG